VDGRDYSIDGPDEEFLRLWKEYFAGDALALSEAYYRLMGEMIGLGGFQILGHIDLVKKKNDTYGYLDEREPRYRDAVGAVLDRLQGSGIFLEINSGGIFRGATSEVYPSRWILTEAFKRDLPLMINADAHRPEAIDFHLEESRTLARESGYRKLKVLIGGQWRDDPL
jgi:histidinol-phosphatase (PHP family)